MKYFISFITLFLLAISCSNDDDAENSIYSTEYKRYIIYKDSVASFEGNGVIRVAGKNNVFDFQFEVENKEIEPIKNIKMEMTGSSTLRNVDWTPSNYIMMTKDSLNIIHSKDSKRWIVNGNGKDTIK